MVFSILRDKILQIKSDRAEEGFSLIELMVVIALVGILSTIAAPTWLGFVRQQRVTTVNDEISLALQDAQRKARSTKLAQSVSVRVTAQGIPQVVIYPKTVDVTDLVDSNWTTLGSEKQISGNQILLFTNIDKDQPNNLVEVTAGEYPQPKDTEGPVTIIFDQQGALDLLSDPSLTTGTPPNDQEKGLIIGVAVPRGDDPTLPVDNTRRCMVVRTLLGSMELESGDTCQPWP